VTTVEIKTGYGLYLEAEGKMIQVMKELEKRSGITIIKTFLGAHALPPEYADNGDGYVDLICRDMIPAFAREVDFVDVFCESIAFTPAQTERIFEAARRNSLGIKIHAEQLSNMGGAALAAHYKAMSADHLEYLDEAGVKAMAEQGTTAVLLPGAFYFLKESKTPPIQLFRNYGVPMAIATDSNPGSSPCLSLLLMLNMACTLFRLSPEEALAGVTKNAAKALGIESEAGSLEPGKAADMALYDVKTPTELAYSFGGNPCVNSWKGGKVLAKKK
jgi:imidazolonepropionase